MTETKKIDRGKKLECIGRIAATGGWGISTSREKRRERGRYVVELVANTHNAAPALDRDELYGRAYAAFRRRYGKEYKSAILMFLAFQLIWWFIENHLLTNET